jgi:hypothetical protein
LPSAPVIVLVLTTRWYSLSTVVFVLQAASLDATASSVVSAVVTAQALRASTATVVIEDSAFISRIRAEIFIWWLPFARWRSVARGGVRVIERDRAESLINKICAGQIRAT